MGAVLVEFCSLWTTHSVKPPPTIVILPPVLSQAQETLMPETHHAPGGEPSGTCPSPTLRSRARAAPGQLQARHPPTLPTQVFLELSSLPLEGTLKGILPGSPRPVGILPTGTPSISHSPSCLKKFPASAKRPSSSDQELATPTREPVRPLVSSAGEALSGPGPEAIFLGFYSSLSAALGDVTEQHGLLLAIALGR